MSEEAAPLVLSLTVEEATEITGGIRVKDNEALYRRLSRELANGFDVRFTDEQLGELVRVMAQHGSGGFAARAWRAFRRPLFELLSDKVTT